MTVKRTSGISAAEPAQTLSPGEDELCMRGCLAGQLRMLNRVVTGFYEDELRGEKVRISQSNLLAVILGQGPITPSKIAKVLHLDKSTVTRDVSHLLRHEWVEQCSGADERSYALQITSTGRQVLKRSRAGWLRAQEKARRLLGDDGVALLEKMTDKLMHQSAED